MLMEVYKQLRRIKKRNNFYVASFCIYGIVRCVALLYCIPISSIKTVNKIVALPGIEPGSGASETLILSIVLQSRCAKIVVNLVWHK